MQRLISLKDAQERLKMNPQTFLPLAEKAGIFTDRKRGGQFLSQDDFDMILLTTEQFAKVIGCPTHYLHRSFYAAGEADGVAKTIFTVSAAEVCQELAIAPSDLHRMASKGAVRSYVLDGARYFDAKQIESLKPAKKPVK
jgi:hypothetical protein